MDPIHGGGPCFVLSHLLASLIKINLHTDANWKLMTNIQIVVQHNCRLEDRFHHLFSLIFSDSDIS